MGKPSGSAWMEDADTKAEQAASLYGRVLKEVEAFQPFAEFDRELPYHSALATWMMHSFPDLKYEEKIEASIPDMTIGDIAIEVKGPTAKRELDSLIAKCIKYDLHWSHVILVVFRPQVTQYDFDEIVRGLKRFPNVEVVR